LLKPRTKNGGDAAERGTPSNPLVLEITQKAGVQKVMHLS